MKIRPTIIQMQASALIWALLFSGQSSVGQVPPGFKPDIPRTWEDGAIASLEVPLANPIGSPKHVSAAYYYQIPVRPIDKQYPVYAPGREPAGYLGKGSSIRSGPYGRRKEGPNRLLEDIVKAPRSGSRSGIHRQCVFRRVAVLETWLGLKSSIENQSSRIPEHWPTYQD